MLTPSFISRTQVQKAESGVTWVVIDDLHFEMKQNKVVGGPKEYIGKTRAEIIEMLGHDQPAEVTLTPEQEAQAQAEAAKAKDQKAKDKDKAQHDAVAGEFGAHQAESPKDHRAAAEYHDEQASKSKDPKEALAHTFAAQAHRTAANNAHSGEMQSAASEASMTADGLTQARTDEKAKTQAPVPDKNKKKVKKSEFFNNIGNRH
jgi:hypothetical protein